MIEKNSNRAKMLASLSYDILSTDQVLNIFDNPKEFPVTLIEKLSIETALKYYENQLSYEAADYIMNNLYSFWINSFAKTYPFTDAAWECYEAFDAGEYYRENDDRSINPEVRYTRPLVEELLRKRLIIS